MGKRDEDFLADEPEKVEDMKPILETFWPFLGNPVEVVITKISKTRAMRAETLARDLYKLNSRGLVKLVDPDPPKSLFKYLFSLYSLRFWVIVSLTTLMGTSIFIIPPTYPFNYLRAVTGLIFPLYLPGYVLIEALYPKRDDIGRQERFLFGIGSSIILVTIIGFILNYTPWRISLNGMYFTLVFLILMLGLVAAYRKFTYANPKNLVR